jgi:hypothetical protein
LDLDVDENGTMSIQSQLSSLEAYLRRIGRSDNVSLLAEYWRWYKDSERREQNA